MKSLAPILFAVSAAAAPALAFADEPAQKTPAALIAENPFAAPLTLNGVTSPTPANEDLTSPFVEAHFAEQYSYTGRYIAHYHFVAVNPSNFDPGEPTSPVDKDGRPLWFDGSYGDTMLHMLIARLLETKHFDDLDRLVDDWSNPSERMADGRWKLVTFYDEIKGAFSTVSDWDAAYQIIRDWKSANPKSRGAALAEALYWYEYAWNARGDGWASSVSSEGWKLFHERLEKAEAALIESKPYAATNPLWGRIRLDVGLGLEWSKQDLLREFQEDLAKAPDFEPLYAGMLRAMTPAWGGDWRLVDAFIRAAVKNTEAAEGYSMYAWLYWSVDSCNCGGADLFHESLANWPDMKRGFEDLIRRYPHSAALANKYAAYACIADDKDTFQRLRLRIGKTITREAWPQNHSLDLCEHKFPVQPL